MNATDKRFFWLALYCQPALWVALAVVAVVRLEFIWLTLVGECDRWRGAQGKTKANTQQSSRWSSRLPTPWPFLAATSSAKPADWLNVDCILAAWRGTLEELWFHASSADDRIAPSGFVCTSIFASAAVLSYRCSEPILMALFPTLLLNRRSVRAHARSGRSCPRVSCRISRRSTAENLAASTSRPGQDVSAFLLQPLSSLRHA